MVIYSKYLLTGLRNLKTVQIKRYYLSFSVIINFPLAESFFDYMFSLCIRVALAGEQNENCCGARFLDTLQRSL